MKSLPARPSLESLRKQAKHLAHDVALGDSDAIARVRGHLPDTRLPLTQRNAQLVIAREYGYAGWQELTAEVSKRLGDDPAWAIAQARRAIHDNDVAQLKQLLAEHPTLLAWRGDDDAGLLGVATSASGDAFEPNRERDFTRAECAEVLIDAGAAVVPAVYERMLSSRTRGLLEQFRRKGLLPRELRFFAALGDLDAVRTALRERGDDRAIVNEAFVCGAKFQHGTIASILLERSIALDPELGAQIDASVGRVVFVKYFIENRPTHATALGLWKGFVMERISRAIVDGDLAVFVRGLENERWLLDDAHVDFQNELIGAATLNGRGDFITALLDRDPAILRCRPPLPSQAIEFAATYAHTDLIPLLSRVWPLPDDLPYAAATGNFARVTQWFDESGKPALGDLERHYPYNDAHARDQLHWNPRTQQQILDVALAFSVINHHFDVADFLLAHGADINTNWNSHEPASILHDLVFEDDYEAMQFLIDRGIDLTIRDYRWSATAYGWALYGKNDGKMAQWLKEAEQRRMSDAR